MAHPDEQISDRYRREMNAIANALDETFNGTERPKRVCFVLLQTNFSEFDGPNPRVNYISNGERKDIVTMLKEIVARFEGQPKQSGKA